MSTRKPIGTILLSAMSIICAAFAIGQSGVAHAGGHVSDSPVYWLWDQGGTPVGTSKLVRTPNGISAMYRTADLPAGHAMTLWFIVFNNPAACATTPCTLADFETPEAAADFLVGGGVVTGGGRTTIGGHLRAGDNSGSGYIEFGLPQFAVGLTNPLGADVILALHSHGPKRSGRDLVAQISSFLGGCDVFLGPGGFAGGPSDLPAADGECSTIQVSTHTP